jgi:hypothetical protein
MNGIKLIDLTASKGHKVWINCDKVLYLDVDHSAAETMCIIHLHGQATIAVKESIFHVSDRIKTA